MVRSDRLTRGRRSARMAPPPPTAEWRPLADHDSPVGRSVVGELGLLALLLTIGIMAVLVGKVISGVAATEQQELVDAGLLGQPMASQNVSIVDGTLVIEGIGDCLDE